MLYEFGYHFRLTDIFKLLYFVLPVVLFLSAAGFDKKIIRWSVTGFATLVMLFILYGFWIEPICSYLEIKQNIDEGELCVVEGEVNNFYTPDKSWYGHDCESFTIDGVVFSYYGTENYGYSRFFCDGGVVTGNGQRLRISYWINPSTDEIVICYIEEPKEVSEKK